MKSRSGFKGAAEGDAEPFKPVEHSCGPAGNLHQTFRVSAAAAHSERISHKLFDRVAPAI